MRLLRAQMPRRYSSTRYATGSPTLLPSLIFVNNANNTAVPGDASTAIGDLCIAFFGSAATATIPPTGTGFTLIDSDNGDPTASVCGTLCFRVNTSSNQSASGFTGANRGLMAVFRDTDNSVMNGLTQVTGGGGTFDYPALTLTEPSLVLIGHMPDDTEIHAWPAGFTQIVATGGTAPQMAMALSDTERPTSWAGESVAQTGTQLGITFSLAIRGA